MKTSCTLEVYFLAQSAAVNFTFLDEFINLSRSFFLYAGFLKYKKVLVISSVLE